MPRMLDGLYTSHQAEYFELKGLPDRSTLNKVFEDKNLADQELNLVERLITQYHADVKSVSALLEKYRLRPAGWTIDCHFLNESSFFAAAEGTNPNYRVLLSIGITPLIFSVAAELELLNNQVKGEAIRSLYACNENSIEDWFPWLRQGAQPSESAIQVTLDAALLLYLHEVAHIIFGHCSYEPMDANEIRALEADADFNAGTMFALWLRNLYDEHRRPKDANETVARLIRASFILGVVLKALSKRSPNYHFPTVRTELFYAGGSFGIESTGGVTKVDKKNLQKFWVDLKLKVIEPLQQSLRNSSLRHYAGTEEEINKDVKDMGDITLNIRNRLKDHELKEFKIPTF